MRSLRNFSDYSYKIALLASILLLIFHTSAFAQAPETSNVNTAEAEVFSVNNIIVDADGKDKEEVRAKALAEGELDAFKQLVTKVSPTKAPDIIAKITTSQISQMMSGYEVISEKATLEHYHAVLRYNFSPQSMHTLLALPDAPQQKDAAATAHKSKAVLVLPVYKEANGTLKLWQDDNKWRNVWYESALESSRGYVVAPLGDLDDRVDVDDTNIDSATSKSLSRMYDRYGVGEIYILYAFFNKKADPKPTLEVTVKKLIGDKDETSRMDYIIHTNETLDTLMARGSSDIADHVYKLQTIDPTKIEYDRLKEINARVNVSNIHDWEDLRTRLLTHGNIVSIKLTSISFYETSMVITFRGTPDMLGKTLVASGLRVLQDGDNLVLMLK